MNRSNLREYRSSSSTVFGKLSSSCFVCALVASAAAQGSLNQGLIAYYPLAGNVTDQSGNGHNGTIYGSPTWVAGPFLQANGALHLNGATDYVWLGTGLRPSNITACVWFRRSSSVPLTSEEWIIGDGQYGWGLIMGAPPSYTVPPGDVSVYPFYRSPSDSEYVMSATPPQSYDDGSWHLAAMTYDGFTVSLYVDAVLKGTHNYTSASGIWYYVPGFLSIGVRDGAGAPVGYFDGDISECRIFSRALSATEILLLFTSAGPGTFAPAPVPINPPNGQVVKTFTPVFQWSPFQKGTDGETQAGYELRVRSDDTNAWDFNDSEPLGTPPSDWEDASQTPNHTYRNTIYAGRTCLEIQTAANTADRVKVRTTSADYRVGTYDWIVYVPQIIQPGDATSLGAFLLSPTDNLGTTAREMDFEIGLGTMVCYMTLQPDPTSGTLKSTSNVSIIGGQWYDLRLLLGVNEQGNYLVSWLYAPQGGTFQQGFEATCNYGPRDTAFQIYCSVENMDWIGSTFPPKTNHTVDFDKVLISDSIVYDTGYVPSTSASSHAYSPGLYNGVDPQTHLLRTTQQLALNKHYHWHARYFGSAGNATPWSADDPNPHQTFSLWDGTTANPIPIFDSSIGGSAMTSSGFQTYLSGLSTTAPTTIYASTDLRSWTPIFTNPPSSQALQFLDQSGAGLQHRFYRAVSH